MKDRHPKSTWTQVFTDGSTENAARNGGSGAYIRHSDGTISSLSIPAGDLNSNYREELHALKATTEHLIEEDCNQQNIVMFSDPCLLFSLSQMASLTFAPSRYTTACVLCQTTTELCSSGCQHMLALLETRVQTDWQRQQ